MSFPRTIEESVAVERGVREAFQDPDNYDVEITWRYRCVKGEVEDGEFAFRNRLGEGT